MKGLILSVTAGQGHNQTASVLCDGFNDKGIECSYMDSLEYINPILSDSVSHIYLMSTKNLPKIYGRVYRMCEKRPNDEMHGLPKITTQLLAKKLLKKIENENPDFIICTHVFAAILINSINDYIDKKIKTYGIVTDFTVHPYWEDTNLDYYVTPSVQLTGQAERKGIPKEKLLPIGIPIAPKFASKISKEKALNTLGLPVKRTVLVMSGSMGFGDVASEILALAKTDMDFQIVTICGNNKKLKKSIDKINASGSAEKAIYNYGYVNNVDVFMDASDCIVTKPGGLTSSEALAKGIPMLISNPIPGQEDRNVEFLLNSGAAIKVSNTYPISDALMQLFSNDRYELIRHAISSLGRPNSTRDLIDFVISNI